MYLFPRRRSGFSADQANLFTSKKRRESRESSRFGFSPAARQISAQVRYFSRLIPDQRSSLSPQVVKHFAIETGLRPKHRASNAPNSSFSLTSPPASNILIASTACSEIAGNWTLPWLNKFEALTVSADSVGVSFLRKNSAAPPTSLSPPPNPIQFKIIVPTHPFHIDRQRLFRYTVIEAVLNVSAQYL